MQNAPPNFQEPDEYWRIDPMHCFRSVDRRSGVQDQALCSKPASLNRIVAASYTLSQCYTTRVQYPSSCLAIAEPEVVSDNTQGIPPAQTYKYSRPVHI